MVQEALSGSSCRRATGAAKKVLAEEGIPYEDTRQAYQQLHKVVSKRGKQRRQQLVDRVNEAMQEEREKGQEGGRSQGTMQRQREMQVNKLLHQLIQRKQTAALQLEGGRKVAGVQKVGEELAKFRYGVLTSPDVTVQACEVNEMYLLWRCKAWRMAREPWMEMIAKLAGREPELRGKQVDQCPPCIVITYLPPIWMKCDTWSSDRMGEARELALIEELLMQYVGVLQRRKSQQIKQVCMQATISNDNAYPYQQL